MNFPAIIAAGILIAALPPRGGVEPDPEILKAIAADDAKIAHIVLINGDCSKASPLGDITDYTVKLRAKHSHLGFIRIRSRALFDAETDNVLGTVPGGTILWGQGPLKDGEISDGLGYAVAIRDKDGNIRRGYVSLTVVDVILSPLQATRAGTTR